MTTFVLIAIVLVAIAIVITIYPFFKKHRALAIVFIIGFPLLTLGLYRFTGSPKALDAQFIAQNKPAPDINTALSNLQEELKSKPDNLEGWVLLARTQMAMGDFEAANTAFKKAIALAPENPDLKAELAEAMLRSSKERSFPIEAVELLQQALAQNPEHERALFFIGMHYLQQGDSTQAEIYLNKLLPKLDAEAAVALREQINIARAQQNKPQIEASIAQEHANTPSIKVTVSLDNSIASAVKPGAVLFVFAKSIAGGGPPVAAKRIETTTFPIQLELSDSDSLMPTANLSSQEKVSLSARISLQGVANSQVGDIEADAVIVETTTTNTVEIKLSRVKK